MRSVREANGSTVSQIYRYEPAPTSADPFANRGLLEQVRLRTESQEFETRYEYLPQSGRLATLHYPASSDGTPFAVQYCYDTLGATMQAADAYSPAADCSQTEGAFWQRASTLRGLAVNGTAFGNGVSTSSDLNPATFALRGISIDHDSFDEVSFDYTYLPSGRLRTEVRSSNAVSLQYDREYNYADSGVLQSVTDSATGDPIFAHTYNGALQLETLQQPDGSAVGPFVYEDFDGVATRNRPELVGDNEFEYDARGNQWSREGPDIPGGSQTIDYNSFNLPTSIVTGTGGDAFTTLFDYDSGGSRVHTVAPASEAWHQGGIYEKVLDYEYTGQAEEHRYYVFVDGERVAQVRRARLEDTEPFSEDVQYFHLDRMGSVIALTAADGSLAAELGYSLYGTPDQPMPTPFGFTGHRHEEALGLIDAGGRFYDPQFGIFLTPDPIGPLSGGSPRGNRYAYVGYDPINFVDPTGYWPEFLSKIGVRVSDVAAAATVFALGAGPLGLYAAGLVSGSYTPGRSEFWGGFARGVTVGATSHAAGAGVGALLVYLLGEAEPILDQAATSPDPASCAPNDTDCDGTPDDVQQAATEDAGEFVVVTQDGVGVDTGSAPVGGSSGGARVDEVDQLLGVPRLQAPSLGPSGGVGLAQGHGPNSKRNFGDTKQGPPVTLERLVDVWVFADCGGDAECSKLVTTLQVVTPIPAAGAAVKWWLNWRRARAAEAAFGAKSVGAAQRVWRTLQTGGNTIRRSTAKALNEAHGLNLHSREWGRALEGLKDWKGLGPNFHQTKILESGRVVNTQTGETIGSLLEFLP